MTEKRTSRDADNRHDIDFWRVPVAKNDAMTSFDFIYEILTPYYPTTGRPSIASGSMFKMLLVDYLCGIKSERRLVEETQLNVTYRWFCGFKLGDTIPNHTTFGKTRVRKWD